MMMDHPSRSLGLLDKRDQQNGLENHDKAKRKYHYPRPRRCVVECE
jgi:hypothetical protein